MTGLLDGDLLVVLGTLAVALGSILVAVLGILGSLVDVLAFEDSEDPEQGTLPGLSRANPEANKVIPGKSIQLPEEDRHDNQAAVADSQGILLDCLDP